MKEALKLALETLRNTQDYKQGRASVVEAVEDIEEALAQQEPVVERAWFTIAELNAWANKKLLDNPQWVMPTEEPERTEALAQPAQEPVAWLTKNKVSNKVDLDAKNAKETIGWSAAFPVYTTPQQRPWVGLTEAQFLEAVRLAENGNYLVAFVRIQEWLKEQNT